MWRIQSPTGDAGMKPANNAPVYVALYPDLAEIFRRHGYALAIHGSLARDCDLIGVPWTEKPSSPKEVIEAVLSVFALRVIDSPHTALHGREVWTLAIGMGQCFFDVSFMPTLANGCEAGIGAVGGSGGTLPIVPNASN